MVISAKIRDALRQSPDGMTAKQLAIMLGATPSGVSRSLALMPDVYIDRWIKTTRRYAGVHCLAFVPADCPRP